MTRRTVLTGSLGLAAGAATSLPFLVPKYDHDRRPACSRVAILPATEYSEKDQVQVLRIRHTSKDWP
jgi:hypothetical protein